MQGCRSCPHFVVGICDVQNGVPRPAPCERECQIARCDADVSALFERHHRHVVAWACRMSGNYDLARDVAQDVFVKAWAAWDRFRGGSQFSTWLYTITRNCYRDHLKARAARPREVDDGALWNEPPVVQNDAIASLEVQHAAALVRRLIRDARLDRMEAEAFRLHYGHDMPIDEVTARLGLTNRSGARAPLVSAKRKLRRSLERWQRLAARTGAASGDHAAA